jgi:hypothetical protein
MSDKVPHEQNVSGACTYHPIFNSGIYAELLLELVAEQPHGGYGDILEADGERLPRVNRSSCIEILPGSRVEPTIKSELGVARWKEFCAEAPSNFKKAIDTVAKRYNQTRQAGFQIGILV